MIEMGMGEEKVLEPPGIHEMKFQVRQVQGPHDGDSRIEEGRFFRRDEPGGKFRRSDGIEVFADLSLLIDDHDPSYQKPRSMQFSMNSTDRLVLLW